MAKPKKTNEKPLDDAAVERALYDAMSVYGLVLPLTPQAVERAEHESAGADMVLPPALREPPDFDKWAARPFADESRQSIPYEICENLARAARDGKTITPDVEARMQVDRAQAEQKGFT